VGNHQVPWIVDDVSHVPLIVRARSIGREKVAGHGFMPSLDEGIPDGARILTGYEDSHQFWRVL
jgi:hypothetical protein